MKKAHGAFQVQAPSDGRGSVSHGSRPTSHMPHVFHFRVNEWFCMVNLSKLPLVN